MTIAYLDGIFIGPSTIVKEQEVVHAGAGNGLVTVATIELLNLALWDAVHDRADLLVVVRMLPRTSPPRSWVTLGQCTPGPE